MYLMLKGLWGAIAGDETTGEAKEQLSHAAIVLNLRLAVNACDRLGECKRREGTVSAILSQTRHGESALAEGEGRLVRVCSVKPESSRHGAGRPRDEDAECNCSPSEDDIGAVMLCSIPPR